MSYFFLMISRSTELMSEKRGNYNNVNLRAKSFQSRIHMITIIQNFTLVNLTSTTTPHLFELPFRATVLFHLMHSTAYILDFLPSMQSEDIFDCRNYLYFVYLLRNEVYHFSNVIRWNELSY